MTENATKPYIVELQSRPAFTRYARLHDDQARQRTVLLAPERAYELDAISLLVLRQINGRTPLSDLCQSLAQQFTAPFEVIAKDVLHLLQGLADKRLLCDGPPEQLPTTALTTRAPISPRAGGPTGLLAELTHRCPLQCPYCSNPLELERANTELQADQWGEIFRQAASIGVLQLHLSGGEPTARRDIEEIISHAVKAGLYTNLITSAVLLTQPQLQRFADIGLDHVQISIQDIDADNADYISGYRGGVPKKYQVAQWVRNLGLGLTINAPIHRQNIENLPKIIDFAVEVDAQRIEIAHIQYYAWAITNRAALIPTRETFLKTVSLVEELKAQLKGVLNFDFVVHDHYATRPKTCTGGWGQSILVVTPSGKALPCHAAQTLPNLTFDNVLERPLEEIWFQSSAFNAFRGTEWMKEPCRSCDRREIDFGGCRCQAFLVTNDPAATDPACSLSPQHAFFAALGEDESLAPAPAFIYRRFGSGAFDAN